MHWRNEKPARNCVRAKTTLEFLEMNSFGDYPDQHALILLIDEETRFIQELAATLHANGYRTRCCATAADAFAAAREDRPDFVICDVVVQELSGLEICEQIKRDTEPGELPVMFLSGNQIPDIIRRRSPFGGSYYLRKPIDPNVLLDLLARTLNCTRQLALVEK
jgi:two-component system, cell cycle response regulator